MAIEIIPKSKTKQEVKISPFGILYWFVICLLFLSFLSYFGLILLYKNSEEKLEELEIAILQKETEEARLLEERVLESKRKIDAFSDLFTSYKKSSGLFNFLKRSCHKKVFFTKVDLDIERFQLAVSGKTEGFKSLGEQILIFREEGFIKNLVLSKVSLEKEGGVEFELTLSFSPEIFK